MCIFRILLSFQVHAKCFYYIFFRVYVIVCVMEWYVYVYDMLKIDAVVCVLKWIIFKFNTKFFVVQKVKEIGFGKCIFYFFFFVTNYFKFVGFPFSSHLLYSLLISSHKKWVNPTSITISYDYRAYFRRNTVLILRFKWRFVIHFLFFIKN